MTSQPNARFHTEACRNAAWYAAQRESALQNALEAKISTARAVDD
jgi:hypothetical protein